MKRNLLLSMMVCTLTFLGISSVSAMEREGGDAFERLSVGASPSRAALPPSITIGGDELLHIEAFFEARGRTFRLRTPTDQDFYLDGDAEADPVAIAALGELTAEELGSYLPNKLGPVTIQRRNPELMAFYENGVRTPVATIGTHWPNIWKKRLQNHSPSTLYVLEEMLDEGRVNFVGHMGLGHQSDTQWVVFDILEEAYQRQGIGEAMLRYKLETFIPALYGDPIVGQKVSGYNSLLLKTDKESPLASVVSAKVRQLGEEGYRIEHKENADRPGGRKGHEVVIDLTPIREKALSQAQPFTPPAGAASAAQ